MAKGDPNIVGTFFVSVTVPDVYLFTTPVGNDVGIFAVPDGAGYQVEAKSITIRAQQLVVDAADPVTADIEWVDDSAADAVTNLNASAIDLKAAGLTVLVGNTVWQGSQILDPGDSLNLEITSTTPTTAGLGYVVVLEARIIEKSGS